jgi:hypothetical protein
MWMKPPGIATVLEMAEHGPLLEEMDVRTKSQCRSRGGYARYSTSYYRHVGGLLPYLVNCVDQVECPNLLLEDS